MDELEQLRAAAAALEAMRATLGADVVDAGLGPMLDRIAALESPVAEERKLVTTLFADLVGFTAMSERMDAEDVRTVLDRYFARWTATIERHGGVVEKFIGDAVMAVFGMKQSSEDDPERAIFAALDMVESLAALNDDLVAEGGPRLEMRVGINTGEVVIGAVGERREEEWLAVGDPINVASRLQEAAPVNGVLIAHSTFRHVRGVFDVREMPLLALKGKSEPTQAYVVDRAKPRAFRLPARGVEGVETTMVGREAELKRLQAAFLASADGEPGMVTIVGEAGMGKTRLLEEFATWLDLLPRQIVYIKGRGRQGTDRDAFALVRDAVVYRFEILDTDPPDVVQDKLSEGFGGRGADLGDLVFDSARSMLIGRLLGFDLSTESRSADAQATRELGTAAFIGWLEELAADKPVVIVLDDIHWADDPSLDLAATVIAEADQAPILVVCGARPTLYSRRPAWQAGERRHQRIELLPLSSRQSRHLLAEILHKVPDLPEDLRETVVLAAEGNPFHIEELVKMLIDDGVIVKTGDEWTVVRDRLPTIRVPDTLVGVLQARIDALSAGEKSVLHRAAVIGRSFWDRAVVALGNAPGALADVDHSIAELRARELVYGRESSRIADAAEYIFKHAVLREVAYQSVLRRYRRDYHARAAAWLRSVVEATDRADEFAALIAGHYDAAERAEEAAPWFHRAGNAAASRYANAEALALLDRAMELAPADTAFRFQVAGARQAIHAITGDRAAETAELDAMTVMADRVGDDRMRVDIELRRARQATDVGRQADSERHARLAANMARRIGDTEPEARALLAMGIARWRQGNPGAALPVLTEALDIARATTDVALSADCLHSRGVAHHNLGQFDEAEADYRASAPLWRLAGDRGGLSKVLNSLGILAYDREDFVAARSYLEQSLAAKRAMGDRLGENRVLNNLALVGLAEHHYEGVISALERNLEIARQIDDLDGEAASQQGLGFVALRTGRRDVATEHLLEARRLFAEEGDQQGESQVLELLAQLAHAAGDVDGALALVDEAASTTSAAELPAEAGAAQALLGRISFETGKVDEAEEAYRRALALFDELGVPGRAIEVKAGLAGVLQALGRPNEARALADEVLGHFRERGTTGVSDPVLALLFARSVFEAHGDPRAADVTELARRHLAETAGRMTDPEMRRGYLNDVAAHHTIAADDSSLST
ncbi:MAG TPA: adenylate/guanylate cyclase domain-containing protein [Jiangellaceae bacterium]|jgi:class 3 adenylate cyclase/tetratricopeptide (TPR) repeat protein|nr:adenylate/guanylate cyclase domain-containing protein [Jiangellaceae bacterium]